MDMMTGRCRELDVYRPKQAQGEDLPVIISVHGGAWMYGDKERYQYYCMSLAQRGFAVVNFTYRLAHESKISSTVRGCESGMQVGDEACRKIPF
ncbi:MAG: carboxylesterase family protein [Ruminococcus sp.]